MVLTMLVWAGQWVVPGHGPLTFVLGHAGLGRTNPIYSPKWARAQLFNTIRKGPCNSLRKIRGPFKLFKAVAQLVWYCAFVWEVTYSSLLSVSFNRSGPDLGSLPLKPRQLIYKRAQIKQFEPGTSHKTLGPRLGQSGLGQSWTQLARHMNSPSGDNS